MREPDFWWEKPGILSRLLWPIAAPYGAIAAWRMRRAGLRADIPVVCVGNFTLGGTGKTPTALAIARLLTESGERPFFLTRGYGGSLGGPLRVDTARHKAGEVGDEPLLLARCAPTIVARDRAAGARLARESGASVIVMDDGLQNPSLAKDLSIALVDGRRGFGNSCVFPAGPLRAPLRAQLDRVQAVLVVGKGVSATRIAEQAQGRPLLHARLEPSADAIKAIGRRKVLAFAGIGDPEKFFLTLAAAGIEARAEESFPDHHPYTEAEAAALLARCESGKLLPVTTEKDLVRLAGLSGARAKLAASALALPVALAIEEKAEFRALLMQALAARRG